MTVFGKKPDKNDNWERETLEKLAFASLKEQRTARRWGIFFKLLIFIYLFALLIIFQLRLGDSVDVGGDEKHTAVVEVNGVIASDADANADDVIHALRKAFEDEDTAGVIVRINSPGGSPVQSGYINDEMWRLRKEYPDIPLHAVITDLGASGGYYIAVGAENIYADKSSLVGSIGVIMSSFGFVETIEKLGIERRLMTAGENKGFLDPFSPEKSEERDHVQVLLDQMHQQFIETVKTGRGDRLKEEEKVFSGLIWTGEEAVRLGLVDDLASSSSIARNVIGAEKLVSFTAKKDVVDRLLEDLGADASTFFWNQTLTPRLQ